MMRTHPNKKNQGGPMYPKKKELKKLSSHNKELIRVKKREDATEIKINQKKLRKSKRKEFILLL